MARISRQDVRKELVIHNMTKHPNIVRFIAHDELPNQRMCIVLELVRGGELFDRIGACNLRGPEQARREKVRRDDVEKKQRTPRS